MFKDAIFSHQKGQLAEAERLYRKILDSDACHIGALTGLGTLRLQQGQYSDAHDLLEQALQLDSSAVEARIALGTALHLLARHAEAAQHFEQILEHDSTCVEAYYGLGLAQHAMARTDLAISCFQRALARDPEYAEASCALGAALQTSGRHAQAIENFDRALDVDPEYVEAICGRAESLSALRRPTEAIAAYKAALDIRPNNAQCYDALGVLLVEANRHEEALEHFRAALKIMPNHMDAQIHLGNALEELGRINEAHRAFEAAAALDPNAVRPRYALIMSKDIQSGDPLIAEFEKRLASADERNDSKKILLQFGLAKAMSDIGRQDDALKHMLLGNALKRQQVRYDEAATLTFLAQIRKTFTAKLLQSKQGMGHPSRVPVFIVGMPRSGSTLIEQILSSHPSVVGGGERPDFADAMAEIAKDCLESPDKLKPDELWGIGANYLDRLIAGTQVGAPERITDKMLANFCLVGLIHLALPNARFIHTRRDPIATCLSCFAKLFGSEQPFTYDLAELGRYYRAYQEVMDHWQRTIAPSVVLDVRYESVVDNLEYEARRIVEHCGLAWSEECLAFERNARTVRTASVTQVRKPIYRSAVDRHLPDDALLRPLIDALAGVRP